MKKEGGVLLVIILILVLSCTPSVPSEKSCSSAADCVKATCCHPTDAVNKDHGPDCAGQVCTQECVPSTIDCNQGEIKCFDHQCTVVIYNGN